MHFVHPVMKKETILSVSQLQGSYGTMKFILRRFAPSDNIFFLYKEILTDSVRQFLTGRLFMLYTAASLLYTGNSELAL